MDEKMHRFPHKKTGSRRARIKEKCRFKYAAAAAGNEKRHFKYTAAAAGNESRHFKNFPYTSETGAKEANVSG